MTEPDAEVGIHVVACPSGWCAKVIEGTTGAYRTDGWLLLLVICYFRCSYGINGIHYFIVAQMFVAAMMNCGTCLPLR